MRNGGPERAERQFAQSNEQQSSNLTTVMNRDNSEYHPPLAFFACHFEMLPVIDIATPEWPSVRLLLEGAPLDRISETARSTMISAIFRVSRGGRDLIGFVGSSELTMAATEVRGQSSTRLVPFFGQRVPKRLHEPTISSSAGSRRVLGTTFEMGRRVSGGVVDRQQIQADPIVRASAFALEGATSSGHATTVPTGYEKRGRGQAFRAEARDIPGPHDAVGRSRRFPLSGLYEWHNDQDQRMQQAACAVWIGW